MQVRQLEARGKEMQEELTTVYKEKGRLAEDLVGVSRQLQVPRTFQPPCPLSFHYCS